MNLKRTPIIKIRSPIIPKRKLDNVRSSLCSINLDLEIQERLFEVTDCCGNKFIYVNKFTNRTKRTIDKYLNEMEESPYFYLNVSLINNLEFIYWTVKKLNSKNVPVYIETDRDLPEEILELLGNNPFNIVQCNLSQVSNKKSDYISEDEYTRIQTLRTLPYNAKVHGLYVIISINPIIPEITQLKNILVLLTAEKNVYNHIIISFVKILKASNDTDYVVYTDSKGNASRLDLDYFELKNGVWECAQWYKEAIMENIKYLVKEDDISICGATKGCRGISLNVSKKTNKGVFGYGEKR